MHLHNIKTFNFLPLPHQHIEPNKTSLHTFQQKPKITSKMETHFITFSALVLVLFHCTATTTTLAQSPAPAEPSTDVTIILKKAGQFTTLIRLLKTTHVVDRMKTQLQISNQGLTVLAPTDDAFSILKSGTLNSLTDLQQVQLILYHIIPSFLSTTQFQTVPNPLGTLAGDSGQFPLNVTTSGNQVNVSTGIVDANVTKTIYTDTQLAVYQVDKVLLPWSIFGHSPDLYEKPNEKTGPAADSLKSDADASPVAYGAIGLGMHGLLVALIAVVIGFYL